MRRVVDSAAIACAAFVVYTVLGQSVEFVDSSGYLVNSARGLNGDSRHVNFTPLLIGWTRALGWLPISHYEAARSLSAVMACIASVATHAISWRLGASRARAAVAAALVAACPAVMFGATVVGPYVPMFGFAAIAMWLAVRRPLGLVFLAGLVEGFAATVHATGNLLPAAVLPLMWFTRAPDEPRKRFAAAAVLLLAGHVGFLAAFSWLGSALGWMVGTGTAAETFAAWAPRALDRLDAAPGHVWTEWLVPYVPLSILCVVSVCVADTRRLSLAGWVSLPCYVAATFPLLQGGTQGGLYLLPLAVPIAVAAAGVRPALLGPVAVLVSVAGGWIKIGAHDEPVRVRAWVDGLREATGGAEAYLLIGIGEDVEGIFVHDLDTPFFFVPDLTPITPADMRAALPQLAGLIEQQRAAGRRVMLTDAARRWLERMAEQPAPNAGPVLLEFFAEHYTLEPVRYAGFSAQRLTPR